MRIGLFLWVGCLVIWGCTYTTPQPAWVLTWESEAKQVDVNAPKGYVEYDQELFEQQLATQNPTVLFFYSDACISCDALDKDIYDKSFLIPYGTMILWVNISDHPNLAQTYKVIGADAIVVISWDDNFSTISGLTTFEQVIGFVWQHTISIK